jgi:DNA-binding MarR family transcriptional regulator
MHDRELSLESKAIYAYLCALAGSGDYTFPYRQTILRQLGITKNTYYRHYTPLIEQGYITVARPPDKTAANIYTLI